MERMVEDREARAARNQALFRAVNEKMESLNETFEQLTPNFTIVCECADPDCLEMIEVQKEEYLAVRAEPRRFLVRPDHVYPDIEFVVRESTGYVVVEKTAVAGEVAEALAADE
jgi:5-bromo-4-chloroindolyl phosphate hydrolysis protein